jgi:muramoyltetrapeptide carboxypeptidase
MKPTGMRPIRFPKPLAAGDTIAVTAFSSGVRQPMLPRLDVVLDHLRALGFRVVEGKCLRQNHHETSAPTSDRARELQEFLTAPWADAVFPPWGGEVAIDLLSHLDFELLSRTRPKWVLGFSDVSTVLVPLTLRAGWATAHGSNLMDLSPTQTDPLPCSALATLAHAGSAPWIQRSSRLYQLHYYDHVARPDAPFQLTEPTQWSPLNGAPESLTLDGRLIGGCLDTLLHVAGTTYADVPAFIADGERLGVGTLLFLENCELKPFEVARALYGLKLKGWFRGLSGLLLGRSSGPDAGSAEQFGYRDAVRQVLGDCDCPVLLDCDIGHRQPQLTLVLGARARVTWTPATATVEQWFDRAGED